MNDATEHVAPAVLLDYEEGRLDETRGERIKAHLRSCGVCSAELALLRRYTSVPVGTDLGERSQSLRQSIRSRMVESPSVGSGSPDHGSRSTRGRLPSGRVWRSAVLLAAGLAAIAIGLHQLRESPVKEDLGRMQRTLSPGERISLEIMDSDATGWQLRAELQTGLREPFVVITTAQGEILLRRPVEGALVGITRAELGPLSSGTVILAQIEATDIAGGSVRSRVVRLR